MNTTLPQTNTSYIYSDAEKYSSIAITSVIPLIGFVANLLLIIAHVKDPLKTFKTSSSSFILNIAVIDMLASFVWIITTACAMKCTTPDFCDIIWKVLMVIMTISPLSFLSLSIERFCSVAYPLWHRVRITTPVCRYWLCAIWLVHLWIEGLVNYFCLFDQNSSKYLFATVMYTGPLFLLTQLFYLATYISLKKQRQQFLRRQDTSQATLRTIESRLENEKRFLSTLAIVCATLMLTLLPVLSIMLVKALSKNVLMEGRISFVVDLIFLVLLNSNFAVNPFIYLWRLPKYKKTFKKLYCNF